MITERIERIAQQLDEVLTAGEITHGLARTFRSALKEIAIYRNHNCGAAQMQAGTVMTSRRVQLGGGSHLLPGFLNIDAFPPADLLWDIREGLPLADQSVDFVFCEHFLEHVDYPRSAKRILAEIRRVLKDGGSSVIGVPDGRLVIAGYLSGDQRLYDEYLLRWYSSRNCKGHLNTYIDLVNYVFRDQDDDHVYSPHHWAYDYDKLASLCNEAGFREAEQWQFDPDLGNPKRKWGGIYILATK